MAQFIKTDGVVEEIKPERDSFTLYELQKYVGGMVEIVGLPSGRQLVVNEEGKLTGLPENEKATELWKAEYPIATYPHNNDELIVGDVLLLEAGSKELEE